MIPGLTETEARDLILSVGTHRRDRRLSPTEVAELLARALRTNATRAQLAEACQLNDSTIGRFLRLRCLPEQVRALVGWGSDRTALSMTQAEELARLARPEAANELAMKVLEHGFGSKEVRGIVQVLDRSGSSVAEAVDAQLKLRPNIYKQYVFVGLIRDPSVLQELKARTQGERNALVADFLISEKIVDFSGRLGSDQFVLIGPTPSIDVDQVEVSLNSWLEARLDAHRG